MKIARGVRLVTHEFTSAVSAECLPRKRYQDSSPRISDGAFIRTVRPKLRDADATLNVKSAPRMALVMPRGIKGYGI